MAESEPSEQEASKSASSALLLIYDNAVQAATRQAILKRAGYYVFAVLNPLRALEQFQTNDFPAEICMVITDHMMPGMTGAEFVRALREKQKDLPVLVISGLEEAEGEYQGLNVQFRVKPLMPDNLLASVQRMLSLPEADQERASSSAR